MICLVIDQMKQIDLSIMLSALACMFILFAVLAVRPHIVEIDIKQESDTKPIPFKRLLPLPEITETDEKEYTAHLEEHSDITVLFYATKPLGRYYITGYNHEETGSKQTASGAICHEGTISTCAADPRYHKFGEYLEITVNGKTRLYRVEDTGSAVKKKHIDIYFKSYRDMCKYGSNYQTIYRVTFPFGKPKDI